MKTKQELEKLFDNATAKLYWSGKGAFIGLMDKATFVKTVTDLFNELESSKEDNIIKPGDSLICINLDKNNWSKAWTEKAGYKIGDIAIAASIREVAFGAVYGDKKRRDLSLPLHNWQKLTKTQIELVRQHGYKKGSKLILKQLKIK